MERMICPKCQRVLSAEEKGRCPVCGGADAGQVPFENSEDRLRAEAPRRRRQRQRDGLDGLVGGLCAVVINTEPDHHRPAVEELLRYTGLRLIGVGPALGATAAVLRTPGSADVIVTSHAAAPADDAFAALNDHPRSRHLPHTRLETLVFPTTDLDRYVAAQRRRGVNFMTPAPIETDAWRFIRTTPSLSTGTCVGLIQWRGEVGRWALPAPSGHWAVSKPPGAHLASIGRLDHVALRVQAADRDAAILELMDLTGYNYDFSIYVKLFNSITNVTRFTPADAAIVITSGIQPYVDEATSGPTEKFVHNYGPRTHHMAWWTENIEPTFAALVADGEQFLIELVGSPEEGLKQTFSQPSAQTLIVNEYIHRYGDFDGFFTRSNVTALTAATDKQ